MNKVDYIIPLGSCCITAGSLARDNLRIESLPFDWIRPVTLESAIDLLYTNFTNFFDKEDLFIYSQEASKEKHLPCQNKKNNIYFIHDFPENINIEDGFDAVRKKYDMRINRLFERVKLFNHILFIHIYEPSTCEQPVDDEHIANQFSRLKKLFPKKKLSLLFITTKREASNKSFEEYYINPKIRVCTCFEEKEKIEKDEIWHEFYGNLSEIFSCYKINKNTRKILKYQKMKPFEKIKYMLYKIAMSPFNLMCCFIPSKKLRHKTRTVLRRFLGSKNFKVTQISGL